MIKVIGLVGVLLAMLLARPATAPMDEPESESKKRVEQFGSSAPDAGHWPTAMLVIIGAMFAAAAILGPVVRANTPPEVVEDQHGHDDHGHGDHGHSSHGH